MCIAVIIFPIEDVIHFEINLSFLYQSAKLRALPIIDTRLSTYALYPSLIPTYAPLT